jgi:hypothetical protein
MVTPLGSAEWHRLAEQCRARADKLQDSIIRERMLMIADGYDRIANDVTRQKMVYPISANVRRSPREFYRYRPAQR